MAKEGWPLTRGLKRRDLFDLEKEELYRGYLSLARGGRSENCVAASVGE